MNIIIAGAGEVGTHLAKLLSNGNHDVTVIDESEERLQKIDSRFDVLTLHGSPTSIEVLKDAKVKRADLLIAVTPYQEQNIIACMLGKQLGVPKTVARVNGMEYTLPDNKKYFSTMGVDSIIYPEMLAAKEVTNLLWQTGTSKIYEFAGGLLNLFAIRLNESAKMLNKTLVQATEDNPEFNYRAVAITRNNHTLIPRGDDTFQLNDILYVITNQAGVKKLMEYSGKREYDVKNVMILGGSRIGRKIAENIHGNANIKLIEIDKDKSYNLAASLDNTLVINADGRDYEILLREGINEMDAFVAVTGNSEVNVLSCLFAQKQGVKKTIAEVENMDYIALAKNMGVDSIVNKKRIAASHIFSFTMDADVSSVQCLDETNAEILEFVARKGTKITKRPLESANFPKDAIIGGIVRGDKSIIATGETYVQDGDKVVVFALPSAIKRVERFF